MLTTEEKKAEVTNEDIELAFAITGEERMPTLAEAKQLHSALEAEGPGVEGGIRDLLGDSRVADINRLHAIGIAGDRVVADLQQFELNATKMPLQALQELQSRATAYSQHDAGFQAANQAALDKLQEFVERREQGWVLPGELHKGDKVCRPGSKPFEVAEVNFDRGTGEYLVVASGSSKLTFRMREDSWMAPKGTDAWGASAIESGARLGITPEKAAQWFALGHLARISTEGSPAHREAWSDKLDPIVKEITGKTLAEYGPKALEQAYSGKLTGPDLEKLNELLREVEKRTGIDLVRVAVAAHLARFTDAMGWEQVGFGQHKGPGLFNEETIKLNQIPSHVNSVLQARMWNSGVALLDGSIRDFSETSKVDTVPSLTLGSLTPQVEALKDSRKPPPGVLNKLVGSQVALMKSFLEENGVQPGSEIVLVPTPSTSRLSAAITEKVSDALSEAGYKPITQAMLEKRKEWIQTGKSGEGDVEAKPVRGNINFYGRLGAASRAIGIADTPDLPKDAPVIIVDDVLTTGVTREISKLQILAADQEQAPRKVLFMALAKA